MTTKTTTTTTNVFTPIKEPHHLVASSCQHQPLLLFSPKDDDTTNVTLPDNDEFLHLLVDDDDDHDDDDDDGKTTASWHENARGLRVPSCGSKTPPKTSASFLDITVSSAPPPPKRPKLGSDSSRADAHHHNTDGGVHPLPSPIARPSSWNRPVCTFVNYMGRRRQRPPFTFHQLNQGFPKVAAAVARPPSLARGHSFQHHSSSSPQFALELTPTPLILFPVCPCKLKHVSLSKQEVDVSPPILHLLASSSVIMACMIPMAPVSLSGTETTKRLEENTKEETNNSDHDENGMPDESLPEDNVKTGKLLVEKPVHCNT